MSCYSDALRMLARRELSEKQVRQRLERRGHPEPDVEAAIVRLKAERAIDDSRVAEAIARTEVSTRHRGRLRVGRQLERAGIKGATARQAIDDVFGAIDEGELLDAALARRLPAGARIASEKEFARLYRFLLGQGFDADQIVRALKARSVK